MPIYPYYCECGKKKDFIKPMKDSSSIEICECGQIMQRSYNHKTHVIGLSDGPGGFGLKNRFRDEDTGKEITNYREWEKAGYKDKDYVFDAHKKDKRGNIANKVKEKLDRKESLNRKRVTTGG